MPEHRKYPYQLSDDWGLNLTAMINANLRDPPQIESELTSIGCNDCGGMSIIPSKLMKQHLTTN
jgi:hypothetical protein